jgi:4-nitrophenyl phosphatase
MTQITTLLFDMDGVLWRGEQLLIEPQSFFARIREAGLKFGFATNNSTRTPDYYAEKFSNLGVQVESEQVINSALATTQYLNKQYPNGGRIHYVGEWGLAKTLEAGGFELAKDTSENGAHPLAVVAGMDREITYQKIRSASLLIRKGVPFIGTNPDKSFPTPVGLEPGAGSILAAIEAATDVSPTIIGKPQPTMFLQLLEQLGSKPEEAFVIGDRLGTDIQGGQAAGCKTALVLSGVSTRTEAEAWDAKPDIIADDVNAVLENILTS